MYIRARQLLVLLFLWCACDRSSERTRLVLAATTSIEDTGLLDVLSQEFMRVHPDVELAPIAVGTGQAIELGRRGDADVLITHDSVAEMALVASGFATERRSLMYNDFVVAGPADDPAHARSSKAVECLRAIAGGSAQFISRADDSGTHRKELSIWRAAGLEPKGRPWYIEAGVGMGDALLMAGQKHAYILSDRATYLSFRQRVGLDVLCEGDPALLNKYAVTVMKGARDKVAAMFADWITQPATQRLIGDFGRAQFGRSLFTPSALTDSTR
jgi:tungstate transport system substrate-binding protein